MSAITVYGSTGMVGRPITEEAVRRGHTVTAVSRHESPENPVAGATYVTGDFWDTADVVEKAKDADVLVVSVPAPRDGSPLHPIIDAHRAAVDALRGLPTRVFVIGGAGGLFTADGERLVDTDLVKDIYKPEARAFLEVLTTYENAPEDLDWVMLAPSPVIAPGPATPEHVLGTDTPVGDHVSTGTFAEAVVDEIEEPAHRRVRFTVADGE
ncbi:NAD(P)-dependent oxidoreductase [Corynebacterium bovis]|uniref:NADH-flavin reductase n=2 Tax=Corynebacterium bovis TaxID=36808 RepID=A0A3R8QLS6_9CORY|nr:NAD(P)H-binding protein [Corynebacterium bovis]MBB3115186.1 hypothetical protein [Corynebacterium bovis DSM 20582 = CIP 54.80]MDK8509937.1 NAD(P)H-binding protein [Corynebacterium bovis]MDN8578441.1 NAD(P)H-binding protein [Corynebacterium bovis]QQC47859.1 NAD(P)H-binding protein [Corynebacterium bovis]RRO81813.1 NADH-flavin reductase [Corynebacterium bovis]